MKLKSYLMGIESTFSVVKVYVSAWYALVSKNEDKEGIVPSELTPVQALLPHIIHHLYTKYRYYYLSK